MERNVTPFVINSLRVITFVFRINKGYFLVLYPPLPPILSIFLPSTLLYTSDTYSNYILFSALDGEKKKERKAVRINRKLRNFVSFFPKYPLPRFHPRLFVSIAYTRLKWCRDVIFHHRSPSPSYFPIIIIRNDRNDAPHSDYDESRKTRIIDKEIIIFHGRYVTATSFRALDTSRNVESVRGRRERERKKDLKSIFVLKEKGKKGVVSHCEGKPQVLHTHAYILRLYLNEIISMKY